MLYELFLLLFLFSRRLTQVLGNAKPLRRFCISLVFPGHARVAHWLRCPEGVPQGSFGPPRRFPVRFRCFFGVFFGFRGPVLVLCFRFGLVASPSPLGGFSVRPVLAVGFFLSPAVLLHLASFLSRLGKQHCRKPGCNDPGPCRPSI